MAAEQRNTRVSRRAALRTGTTAGAVGVGLAAGVAGGGVPARRVRASRSFEVDFVPVDPVSLVRAGSGPPQRGDSFYVSARIYAAGKLDGPQIGEYQCFGAWTAAGTDMSAPDQRLTTVQFRLDGVGAIMGLINEGGTQANDHIGAVQGGTGAFAGALGTFRQVTLSGPLVVGVAPGTTVVRATFDLM